MSFAKNILQSSIDVKLKTLSSSHILDSIDASLKLITKAFQEGNRVYFCGNGGSAADAQHIAAELSGRFYKDRPALPAEALHVNTSYLTAVANDYSFDQVYARLVDGTMVSGDVLVLFSTSGNSVNIIEAAKSARKKGVKTIAMTGSTGGLLKEWADILINVPSDITPRIQEVHITIGHIICEQVENNIFNH